MTDDLLQLARFARDMALTAPEEVLRRQALFNGYMDLHSKVSAELDAARAELAEVREAAGPFSNLWQDISFRNPYATIDQMVWREGEADHGPYEITYGDLRRLAAALAKDAP
jgi:hypothetical protein